MLSHAGILSQPGSLYAYTTISMIYGRGGGKNVDTRWRHDIQHDDTQHSDTQHYVIQHYNESNATFSKTTLGIMAKYCYAKSHLC
jgi:hypothetical protein